MRCYASVMTSVVKRRGHVRDRVAKLRAEQHAPEYLKSTEPGSLPNSAGSRVCP